MNCPACGKENQPHWKFCLACGVELSPPGAEPAGPPVLYPPGYGLPPSPPVTVSAGGAGASRGRNRQMPFVLISVLLVGVASAGAFFFLRTSSDATSSESPAEPAATPPAVVMPAEQPLPPGPAQPGEPAATFRGIAPQTAEPAPEDQATVLKNTLVSETRGPIQKCWEDHLREGGTASGRIDLQLTIAVDGKVSVSVARSDAGLAGTLVEACVVQAMSRLDFAGKLELTESLVLVYPVILSAQ